MVEGARLERVYTGDRIQGSNPCLTASFLFLPCEVCALMSVSACSKCSSPYAYEDNGLYICPECGAEWTAETSAAASGEGQIRDAYGTELKDGDTVSLIKDLKIKGSSSVAKIGTKIRNIRLVDGDHNIDCKLPGIGQMGLKSEFVKKIS